MIAIADYGAGNMASVGKALAFLGENPVITGDPDEIKKADKVIVPGVGAFEDAMKKLNNLGLVKTLREYAASGRPIFGICLGLQLFFESSEESQENVEGLGLLPGKLVKFPEKKGFKIPHMGWNSLHIKEGSRLFAGIPDESYVYFVHSYYLQAKNEEDVAATSEYIVPFHAAVESGNIFATQFHPEKSGEVGLSILKNFLNL